jgi:hypothetical protein
VVPVWSGASETPANRLNKPKSRFQLESEAVARDTVVQ